MEDIWKFSLCYRTSCFCSCALFHLGVTKRMNPQNQHLIFFFFLSCFQAQINSKTVNFEQISFPYIDSVFDDDHLMTQVVSMTTWTWFTRSLDVVNELLNHWVNFQP